MRIVADKHIPFLNGIVENFGEVEYLAGTEFTHAAIKDADTLLVRTVTRLDKQLLQGTNVKLICSATIGFDHIDTIYCDAHNIAWTNAPGCNSGSVQQYVLSALLVLAEQKGFRLNDKTIGIVGVGNVGQKVALTCELLGMTVLLNDPPLVAAGKTLGDARFVSLHTIEQQADIITFHTPLVRDGEYKTFHLADTSFFASLGKQPIIINSARGEIVDTEAIKEAIRTHKINGAIIDCWENEPNIDSEYRTLVNIATPHIAGYSADGKANATRMSLEAIANFYGLSKSPISRIYIPPVEHKIIDLKKYPANANRIAAAILETYNPLEDSAHLLSSPHTFSQQRGNYPLRREYSSYTIVNASDEERKILDCFDFR